MSDEKSLEILRDYWKAHQTFPSISKLCPLVGMSSTASVFKLLNRLEEAGFIQRIERRIAPTKKFFERPVAGSVRAGAPEPESQEAVELLNLDDYLVEHPNRTTLYRVRGDSMQEAGLLEGDLVIAERNSITRPGDIVVAYVDGEVTVKTLRLGPDNAYFLEAAHPAYAPIHPQASLEILGVVVGSIRKLRR